MRELETSLQEFGEFFLKAQLVKEKAAPHCVRWVRRFLTRPASDESLADQVRSFCEELKQQGPYQEWQVHQAAGAPDLMDVQREFVLRRHPNKNS